MEQIIDYKNEVLDLVLSGCYNIVQQINDGPEEPYEGCEHNLYMILCSPEPTATLLDSTDPQARPNCKTYKQEFDTLMGHCAAIIFE
jgi:hypothetical protein